MPASFISHGPLMPNPRFASFWQGQLSAYERACISSFVRRGYSFTLYSYRPIDDLPEGVVGADASAIVPAAALDRFRFAGKPNLSHFSDYFRYKLFEAGDAIWVDTDMLLLRPFDEVLPDTLLARERQPTICGAILRIGKGPQLDALIAKTEAAMDRDLVWGETGPRLLLRTYGQAALMRNTFPAERFFSIDHDDFWKVLLPAHREECEAMTERSWCTHLWNNVVDRLGIWKRMAPPAGSFLHERWRADGSLAFFADTYPVKVMEQMVENWQLRQSGDALGIRQVARQLLPSIGRTARHYAGEDLSIGMGVRNLKVRFSNA